MKRIEKITANIAANKELSKKLNSEKYYTVEHFISDCERYILAIRQGRMINTIKSVSASGMSKTIKFVSSEHDKKNKRFYLANYNMIFSMLGFTKSRSNDFCFTINGCGMDMIFHTNYTIIRDLYRLGFINKLDCSKLEQMTPQTI